MNKITELKLEIKKRSTLIREMKAKRKSVPYGYVEGLEMERFHARHMHVAYCLLRGREYKEIENAPKTPVSQFWLDWYRKEYSDAEDVCTGT
jgi:hypothetical protein